MNWAYGITTVTSRLHDVFPRTLKSLAAAGFDKPQLFIDGCKTPEVYQDYGAEITCHYPNVRTAGHWALSIAELYIRNPTADRYALFQDDFVTYKNLRGYLESCVYPERGYWNLYTFPSNQQLCPKGYEGWYESNQLGRGAVALIFSREILLTLFSQRRFIDRPQDKFRGHKAIDGGIVDSLKKIGIKEYAHNPSLVQHTGLESSMGNKRHQLAISFRGEEYDALSLCKASMNNYLGHWEHEMQSLQKAKAEDVERESRATTLREKTKLKACIIDYDRRIQRHLQNKPK